MVKAEGQDVVVLTAADIVAALRSGQLTGDAFAWRDGMAEWVVLDSVPSFQLAAPAASRPLSSPPAESEARPRRAAEDEPASAAPAGGSDDEALAEADVQTATPDDSEDRTAVRVLADALLDEATVVHEPETLPPPRPASDQPASAAEDPDVLAIYERAVATLAFPDRDPPLDEETIVSQPRNEVPAARDEPPVPPLPKLPSRALVSAATNAFVPPGAGGAARPSRPRLSSMTNEGRRDASSAAPRPDAAASVPHRDASSAVPRPTVTAGELRADAGSAATRRPYAPTTEAPETGAAPLVEALRTLAESVPEHPAPARKGPPTPPARTRPPLGPDAKPSLGSTEPSRKSAPPSALATPVPRAPTPRPPSAAPPADPRPPLSASPASASPTSETPRSPRAAPSRPPVDAPFRRRETPRLPSVRPRAEPPSGAGTPPEAPVRPASGAAPAIAAPAPATPTAERGDASASTPPATPAPGLAPVATGPAAAAASPAVPVPVPVPVPVAGSPAPPGAGPSSGPVARRSPGADAQPPDAVPPPPALPKRAPVMAAIAAHLAPTIIVREDRDADTLITNLRPSRSIPLRTALVACACSAMLASFVTALISRSTSSEAPAPAAEPPRAVAAREAPPPPPPPAPPENAAPAAPVAEAAPAVAAEPAKLARSSASPERKVAREKAATAPRSPGPSVLTDPETALPETPTEAETPKNRATWQTSPGF